MTELLTMWQQVADGFSERLEAVATAGLVKSHVLPRVERGQVG